MKRFLLSLVVVLLASQLWAQYSLNYFLPETNYRQDIPSPETFFGFQIGDWHLHHAPLLRYMEVLAEKSDRATLYEYARSYEFRPLVHMIITSPANHARLEEIRLNQQALADPDRSARLSLAQMPVVVRLGYGVHGNEPSAHNAAPLVAYYLTAATDAEVEALLEHMVIIIDPSMNPDGQDRFASWVNRHKSHTPNADPNNREFRDVWPGSRSNHYWFDLNRDWLPVQHPESYGRVQEFHRWLPNVNTDHHEFGANSTFFFQPGVPARVHHRTPPRTDELTLKIARYHAQAFDKSGQLYYTQQGFDDFYYGKGSTYPDIKGSIGILFEQAGINGHRRETIHGTLDFAQTIKNQVEVSLSSLRAAREMRVELLDHMRWFYRSALEEASREAFAAYVFGDSHDMGKNRHLLEILHAHHIKVYDLAQQTELQGHTFVPGKAWIVPLRQPEYRLVQTLFETVTDFADSLFYDVSTWSKPLAFNIPFSQIATPRQLDRLLGPAVDELPAIAARVQGGFSHYAYVMSWDDYYAPKALYKLQSSGLKVKVATESFRTTVAGQAVDFGHGSILIPVQMQDMAPQALHGLLERVAAETGIAIHALQTGWSTAGIHPGSGSFVSLQRPEVLMLIGQGVNSRDAGEVWHLLDQRFQMPVTMVEIANFNNMDLSRYNTLVMVGGGYNSISNNARDGLLRWLQGGGTLVALGSANRWVAANELAKIEFVETPKEDLPKFLPYEMRSDFRGARSLPGSIFKARIDITHPIGYGMKHHEIPVYVSEPLAAKPSPSPFGNPLLFENQALMSGYVHPVYKNFVDQSAGVLVNTHGRGTVVSIMHNPNFRAFWFGTNRLFMNALFFGPIMRN